MIKKITTVVIILSLAFVSGFAVFYLVREGYLANSKEEDFRSISVAHIKSDMLANFVLRFAESQGIFQKYGLDVEIIEVEDLIHQRLLTREMDLFVVPTTITNLYFLPNTEIRWIGNIAGHYGGYLIGRYEESEAERISKIGVARIEAIDNFRIRMILRSLGINLERIETVSDLGDNVKEDMMRFGEVDLVFVESIVTAERLESAGFHVWNTENFRDGLNYSAPHIFIMDQTARDRRDDVQSFITASYEAIETILNDEETAVRILAEEMNINRPMAQRLYAEYRPALEKNDYIPSLEKIKPLLPFILDIDRTFRVEKDPQFLLLTEFAERAMEDLGIER